MRAGAVLGAGLLLALLVGWPVWLDSRYALSLLSQMGVAGITCLSYWLLMGQGGMLSFGHALYSGAGAYAAIHLLQAVGGGLGLPVSLLPLAGGLAAALLAWPTGWLATRQSATAFAMITLGLGELAWAAAQMFPQAFGGEAGVAADRTAGGAPWGWSLGPAWQMYLLVVAYTAASAACILALTRTPLGRLLNAVRDNPGRLAFLGQDPRRVRLIGFVLAAFFAGVAGGLSALLHEIVSPEVLGSQHSAEVLVFTFLGGLGSFLGALLGGVLMVAGSVLLPTVTPAWQLYLGLAFLLMVCLAPGGVVGWLSRPRPASWRRSMGQALAAGVAMLGLGALTEMAYQRGLADTLGPQRSYLGVVLDAHAASHWLAAAAVAALATLAWRWLHLSQGGGRP